jgi:iron complex outermembrane receptor protein
MSRPLLLFAVILALAVPVLAQSTSQISGQVRATTGDPLAHVTIELRGATSLQTETDANGRFLFRDLPQGEYELTASLTGFARVQRRVPLKTGDAISLNLTLWVTALETATVSAARTGDRDAQETPLAISALSGSELERVQAHTVEDIAGRAPAVTFSQNTGFGQLTIRGIGTNAVFAGSDPSSAVYVDGVYLARPAMVLADFTDLERVEVLRGPQGTLYGRNAVGGALSLITRDPTNQFEAAARVAAGNSREIRTEVRASGPIIRDRLLASGAVLRGFRQGGVRDLNHEGQFLGGEDVTAARGKLLLSIDRRSSLLISADLTHQDPTPMSYPKVLAVKPGFQVDNPADLHEVRTSVMARSRNVQSGVAARYTLRLSPDLTLTSLSAFRALDYGLLVVAVITELDVAESNVHVKQH